jgi:hypothetical protein
MVVSCDLPASGSGYIHTCQHGRARSLKGVGRRQHQERRSGPVEPSPPDLYCRALLRTRIVAKTHPKDFLLLKAGLPARALAGGAPIPRSRVREGRSRASPYPAKKSFHRAHKDGRYEFLCRPTRNRARSRQHRLRLSRGLLRRILLAPCRQGHQRNYEDELESSHCVRSSFLIFFSKRAIVERSASHLSLAKSAGFHRARNHMPR